LIGLPAQEARGLTCRRGKGSTSGEGALEAVARLLSPPAEVMHGQSCRVRRLLAGRGPGPRWADVEFFPLQREARVLAVLGRVLPLPAEEATVGALPVPEKLAALRGEVVQRYGLQLLTSELPVMRRLVEQVRLAARVRTPVLLRGEPGTGKQTVARIIHTHGAAQESPFVALDCTRLPAKAVTAVLFGEGGGPHPAAQAAGSPGSIYLKEPGRLPRDVQQRLYEELATLPEEESSFPRILAGCCSDPLVQVRGGQLVEDLYYTLATLPLELPALRDRKDDLPWLVERLLKRANSADETLVTGLTPDAWEVVRSYPWPGNLRELYSTLAEARSHATGERISAADLPAALRLQQKLEQTPGRRPDKVLDLDEVLAQVERRLILLTLQQTRGNKSRAAELLSVSRARLLRRMVALKLAEAEDVPIIESVDDPEE
jgi:DNA-binding NtrC family response regulator